MQLRKLSELEQWMTEDADWAEYAPEVMPELSQGSSCGRNVK
jgi:hypothetical protein